MCYENIVVLNILFLKILKVKVGFLEKYAYFMVKIAIILSVRPQKLEAVLYMSGQIGFMTRED